MGQGTAEVELAVLRGQLARQDDELRRMRQLLQLEQTANAKLQRALELMAAELGRQHEASVPAVNVALQVVIKQERDDFIAGIPVRAPQLASYYEVERLA